MDQATLSAWRLAAEEAARKGAAELESWRSRFNIREKGRADVVTEADLASQLAIKNYLLSSFPDHHFLGEEDAVGQSKHDLELALDAPPTWIVDPLDGTANYVHDCPMYCVSIGLKAQEDLVVGVIYDPRQNELFSAAKGQGATLNGKPIRVSQITQIGQALLSTGFPPDPEIQERNLRWWRVFSYHAQALRRTGSTALNMAYVAAGRFDAYWAFDNYVWDIAGGVVLISEAGGILTRCDGSLLDPFKADVLSANPAIHAEMLRLLLEDIPN
jgi:myo-inositol-1(or 4)-monophosphatase